MKKIIIISISLLIFLSCSQQTDKITLGVLAPLSGEGATYGEAMQKGLNLALEMSDNKRIELVYEDTQLSSTKALAAFQKLKTINNVPLIFGAAGSSVSLAVAPSANESKIVLFSSISTADILDNAGEYFFRNIPQNSKQVETIVEYIAKNSELKKVAIYYENNDYGTNMNTEFTTMYGANNIVFADSYESGQTNFRNSLIVLKNSNPDIIFIPGTYNEISLIIRQIKAMKINSQIISGDGAYSQTLINNAGKSSENFMCTLMSVDTTTTMYKSFEDMYKRKYNEIPNIYAIFSYDAFNMVLQVLNEIKTEITGESIENGLNNVSFTGVSGEIKFNQYGSVDKLYNLYIVKNGEFVLYQ